MKKYKLSSLFLVLTLTITSLFSNLSFSHAYNKNQGSKTTFNEYELLKQVNQEYTKSNKKQSLNLSNTVNNLSEKEIDMIVNYRETYSNKIYKLKEWKIEELEAVGYNNEQINAIKTFDGSEEKLVLASTTVDVNVGFRNLDRSSNGTTVDLIAAFDANGIQSNWFNDLFVVVWSIPLTVDSSNGYVRYVNRYGESEEISHNPKPNTLFGREIEFSKNHDGAGSDTYYVDQGSIILSLSSNEYVQDFATYASYGYTSFDINPSANVSSGGGGLGISFSKGVTEAGWDYDSI